jgi:hypothetical protein
MLVHPVSLIMANPKFEILKYYRFLLAVSAGIISIKCVDHNVKNW